MSTLNAATITKQLNEYAFATRSNAMAKRPGLLQEFLARLQFWRRVRRDESWLRSQPDYLLRDIGIDRVDIAAILREGRYR